MSNYQRAKRFKEGYAHEVELATLRCEILNANAPTIEHRATAEETAYYMSILAKKGGATA